ncbi:MAG: hypothetical protein NTZ12_05665 [Candidatus Aminicenantes bacterium]|nr:hypothetical protein [Candidatus Aminicenantes bacterium]
MSHEDSIPGGKSEDKAEGYHAGYREYNKALRTWLVAFGIGGPVLLITKETVLNRVIQQGKLKSIVTLFLIGAVLQIVIAFINKIECWYSYYCQVDENFRKSGRGRFMLWLDTQFWLDISFDLASMICFGLSILLLYNAYF